MVVGSLKLLRADPSWSCGDGKTPEESVWPHAKAFLPSGSFPRHHHGRGADFSEATLEEAQAGEVRLLHLGSELHLDWHDAPVEPFGHEVHLSDGRPPVPRHLVVPEEVDLEVGVADGRLDQRLDQRTEDARVGLPE